MRAPGKPCLQLLHTLHSSSSIFLRWTTTNVIIFVHQCATWPLLLVSGKIVHPASKGSEVYILAEPQQKSWNFNSSLACCFHYEICVKTGWYNVTGIMQ